MADTASILDLALFRCGELVPGIAGGAAYDPAMAGEEVRLAARAVVERLPTEALLAPLAEADAGPEGVASLVDVADASALPYASYAETDLAAPKALRGRAVVGLPADCLRVLRVRMVGWDAAVEPSRFVRGMGEGLTYGATFKPSASQPTAYLTPHAFRATDFPTGGGLGAPAKRLRTALVVAPRPLTTLGDPDDTGAEGFLGELLYVPVPDPERLPDALRDAVAWETAARLLGQDPETAGAQQLAEKKAAEALAALRPSGAVLTPSDELTALVLARMKEQGLDPSVDRSHVREEVRLAARAVVERLPTRALLSPQAGSPYNLSTLLASASLASLAFESFDADDDTAPDGLRGRVVVELPSDMLRLVRVRGTGWTRYLKGERLVVDLDAPYPITEPGTPSLYPTSTRVGALASTANPVAYLTAYDFGWGLRAALVVAPTSDAARDGPYGAGGVLEEVLYVPVPDPAALPDGLRDAVVWEAAGRLSGDPAMLAQAERVLASVHRPTAQVHSRRGMLI